MRSLLLIPALLLALPAGAVDIEWVLVGDPGNPPDTATNCLNDASDCGSVPYAYRISKYEITNAQYVEFLNAVADTDTYSLYNTFMSSDELGGITRSGSPGGYSYAVKSGQGNNPVLLVSWYDTLRFANWLHNGQPTGPQEAGTTETGAYALTGATTVGMRDLGALIFLPTENEWYKAAYYSPGDIYFEYPTGTDSLTGCAVPASDTGNSANCNSAVGALTDVGAYGLSVSPYGTFDQGGNVWEWNETAEGSLRGVRGGDLDFGASDLAASNRRSRDPSIDVTTVGFRVASPVPEPAQVLLVLTGGLVLAAVPRARRYCNAASSS